MRMTPGFIMKLLSKFPKKKAPDEDQISNIALRLLPKNLILALTKIINSCIRLFYFPTAWKRATIISIPKPGKDLAEPDSYRPIALLSSISKVYEKIILFELQRSNCPKISDQSKLRFDKTTPRLNNL